MEVYKLSSYLLEDMLKTNKHLSLKNICSSFGPAMSVGASRLAWATVHVALACGGRRASKNPTCAHRLKKDGSPTEVADTMQYHFASIEGADLVQPQALAQRHTTTIPSSYALQTRLLTNVMPKKVADNIVCAVS